MEAKPLWRRVREEICPPPWKLLPQNAPLSKPNEKPKLLLESRVQMDAPLVFSSEAEAGTTEEEGRGEHSGAHPPLLLHGSHENARALFLNSLADLQDLLMYPSERFPIIAQHPGCMHGFVAVCQAAQEEGRAVLVCADISDLAESVKVTGTLRIYGELPTLSAAAGADIAPDTRPAPPAPTPASGSSTCTTIRSSAHSIFVCSARGSLSLHCLRLEHVLESDDPRLLGACVLARNRSHVQLQDCQLRSLAGFCVWGIQNAKVFLDGCTVCAHRRSGCVLFGSSSLAASACTVTLCGIHGVCLRGATALHLSDCVITDCGHRGVYAYGDVQCVWLQRCSIEGMLDRACGAVEYRPNPNPSPSLRLHPFQTCAASPQHPLTSDARAGTFLAVRSEACVAGLHLLACRLHNNCGYGLMVVRRESSPGPGTDSARDTNDTHDVHIDSSSFDCNAAGDILYRTDTSRPPHAGGQARSGWNQARRGGEPGGAVVDRNPQCDADSLMPPPPPQPPQAMLERWEWEWQFERDDRFHVLGDWKPYDAASQALLETAWQRLQQQPQQPCAAQGTYSERKWEQKEEPGCVLWGGAYSVRFEGMTQINNYTHFERAVRRVQTKTIAKAKLQTGVGVGAGVVASRAAARGVPTLSASGTGHRSACASQGNG